MSVDGRIQLDMKKYGMDGIAVVREPRRTRRVEAANAVGRLSGIGVYKEVDLSKTMVGDIDTIGALMFVESAPFPTDLMDLSGFYAYCDEMDDKEIGSADRFWEDLCDAVTEVSEGRVDPLGRSAPDSPTESSD